MALKGLFFKMTLVLHAFLFCLTSPPEIQVARAESKGVDGMVCAEGVRGRLIHLGDSMGSTALTVKVYP